MMGPVLEAESSLVPPLPPSPVDAAEVTSSNFTRTARMERAAVNDSFGFSLGKVITNDWLIGCCEFIFHNGHNAN